MLIVAPNVKTSEVFGKTSEVLETSEVSLLETSEVSLLETSEVFLLETSEVFSARYGQPRGDGTSPRSGMFSPFGAGSAPKARMNFSYPLCILSPFRYFLS